MRFRRAIAVAVVVFAVSAPVAFAFGFDDGVTPPRGVLDTPYDFALKGRNGCPPYTFVFQNGSLPPGLAMTPDGVITGVPTVVGRYSFWLELRDAGCTGGTCPPAGTSCSFPSQRPFTIDIVAPLSVVAPSLVVGEKGVRLATSVHGAGGRGPYIWELARGPDWLQVGKSGALAGTPADPGRFGLTFALTDHYDDRATATTSLVVRARLVITTTHLRSVNAGAAYAAPLHTNGGVTPFRWKVASGRFPPGLRLDTSTGVIDGAPQKAGRFPLALTVKDAFGVTAAERLTLLVDPLEHR